MQMMHSGLDPLPRFARAVSNQMCVPPASGPEAGQTSRTTAAIDVATAACVLGGIQRSCGGSVGRQPEIISRIT